MLDGMSSWRGVKAVKKIALAAILAAFVVSACQSDADLASRNLSKAADNFEVPRRIVFYNGITGEYMLVIEALQLMRKEINPPIV
jgi:hypothetical protein